jgi:hypothetical protein
MRPCALCQRVEWMGNNPPEQADIIFGAVEGVYGPQNTPMLWRFIIAGTKECFEGHKHPQPPKKYIRKLGRLSSIYSKHWRGAQGLMWGARGPFPPAVAMVVAVVTPVVFCAKDTGKRNKNNKISLWLPKSLFITMYCKTYCNSYIANCSMVRAQVVAWPEPKPLCSNGPRHIGYRQKALVIARMIKAL